MVLVECLRPFFHAGACDIVAYRRFVGAAAEGAKAGQMHRLSLRQRHDGAQNGIHGCRGGPSCSTWPHEPLDVGNQFFFVHGRGGCVFPVREPLPALRRQATAGCEGRTLRLWRRGGSHGGVHACLNALMPHSRHCQVFPSSEVKMQTPPVATLMSCEAQKLS